MLLPISDVPATVIPIDEAIIIKKIGKDFVKADKASGYIFPAKYVSAILYSV